MLSNKTGTKVTQSESVTSAGFACRVPDGIKTTEQRAFAGDDPGRARTTVSSRGSLEESRRLSPPVLRFGSWSHDPTGP